MLLILLGMYIYCYVVFFSFFCGFACEICVHFCSLFFLYILLYYEYGFAWETNDYKLTVHFLLHYSYYKIYNIILSL
jgi:hypothetical protein